MTKPPPPADVRGNDWPALTVPDMESFTPTEAVSVVISYYDAPDALALTLAALEAQTYPRELFEVLIVDDGSPTPLSEPVGRPFAVRVIHQDDRGFGLARARNTGADAAANEILLFLDCDMLPEAQWMMAHARWHHAASDLLSLGFRAHVEIDGIDEAAIRGRQGTLADLFSSRRSERPEWIEYHMSRTADLTSGDDDIFRVVTGGNLGVRKAFFGQVGGFDESFTQWGAEDTEFGYRAFTLGGLLVPVRPAFCWHQGLGTAPDESEAKSLEQQRAKIAHLIAHRGFRRALPGRSFTVPQYLVVVEPGEMAVERILETTEQILANRVHDLVVWVGERTDDAGYTWLRGEIGPDPRVRFGPIEQAPSMFQGAAFHVVIPAGARAREYAIGNLRAELGDRAAAVSRLSGGSIVSITRAWAAHRAQRARKSLSEVADIVSLDWRDIGIRADGSRGRGRLAIGLRLRNPDSRVGRVVRQVQRIRTPQQAWRFLKWAMGAVRQRFVGGARRLPRAPTLSTSAGIEAAGTRARYPLGAEIVTQGEVAGRVFAASSRVEPAGDGHRADLLVVDSAVVDSASNLASDAPDLPRVDLSSVVKLLSVPAFDPQTHNPIRWVRDHKETVAALGPIDRLANGTRADRVVRASDIDGLRFVHHAEDVAAYHVGPLARAATLAVLAACGVVVHVGEDDAQLAACLGLELYELMRLDAISGADHRSRESMSIQMRRVALRTHSLRGRARHMIDSAGLSAPRPAVVSILLATNRPDHIKSALAVIARQTYPSLELVLALHGEGFSGSVESQAAEVGHPVRVVRVAHELTLGDALNTAVSASGGTLLTKFDDDDLYSEDHIWDLVLAHEYSQAQLVAKAAEYVYLARSDKTIHRFVGRGETYSQTLAGGTMLISRHDLAAAGGWRRVPRGVDHGLIEDVERAGGKTYRTHGAGYMLVRHGLGHTWESDDAYFLDQAEDVREGLDEAFAGI